MDYDEDLSADDIIEIIDRYGDSLSPEEIEELFMGRMPESLREEEEEL